MGGLQILTTSPREVEQVLELWRVGGENADRPVDRREAVLGLLERDPDALLVAVDGERLVETVLTRWDGWRAHLYRLAVLPECPRRGIAWALLDAAAERVTAFGATRLDATILESHEDGRSLCTAVQ